MAGGALTDWLTAVGTVGTGIVAVGLAIWGNFLRGLVFKPKLVASIGTEAPYAHHLSRLEQDKKREAYWCRMGIENTGNISAREVEVRLISLVRKGSGGKYVSDPDFRPLNLNWSHTLKSVMPKIDQKLSKYCDLCHVWKTDGDLLLYLDTEFEPAEVRPGVWPTRKVAGTYRVGIAVSAVNTRPAFFTFEIDFRGLWFDDALKMFNEGLLLADVRRLR